MSVNILERTLPDEYQEVEYIESTGTQYIDTNVIPANIGSGFKILIEMDGVSSGRNGSQRYSSSSSTNNYWCLCPNFNLTNNVTIQCGGSGIESIIDSSSATGKHIYGIDVPNHQYIYDNSTFLQSAIEVTKAIDNFYLLADNYNQEATNFVSSKLYGCKIYNNNTLVRDYVPCYNKSNNGIGLYDLVNGVFYTNSGTGTFSKGNDINKYNIQKVTPNIVVYDNPRIPNEYQEVEYVQSSGTQYINTNINLTSDDTVKCKFEITARPTDYNYRDGVYGTMETQSGTNTFFVLLMRDPSQARVGISSNQVSSTNLVLNNIYDTILSNGTYIENGTTYTFTPASSFTFSTSCWFFRRNQSSMLATSAKVYSFEIVGKFNGIPCYRKSDGVIGFYDTITNTFFTNAGTGTFTKGASVDLPSEYQKLGYIQTTGTQYIDTLLYPHQIGKWELDIQYTDNNPSNQTNGCYGTSNQRMDIGTASNGEWTLNLGSLNRYGQSDGYRHLFLLDNINGKVAIDSNQYTVGTVNFSTQTTYTLLIGARNYYGSSSKYNCSEKIYSSKIYNTSGILIRDYIPCYNKLSGAIGLYDLVNGVFYENAGTDTFLKSRDVLPIKKVKAYILNRLLPSEYKRVEYIESTGTQYIDTGIKPDSNTDIDFKYSYTTTNLSGTETRVFGSRGSGNSEAFFIGLHSSYNYCWYINYGDTSNTLQSIIWGTVDTNPHIIKNNSGAFYFDNVNVMNFSVNSYTSPYNAIIFGANADGTIRTTKARVYYCKMYDQGNLVRNFIPCYRVSDNEVGLYDTVNNQFYTNQGTSKFIAGSEYKNLPEEYQQVECLGVSSDEPYIDLGITANQKTKAEVTFSSVETLATCMFGYQANAVGITFNLSERSNNTRFGAWSKVGWGFDMFDGNKHTITISQSGLYQDGTLVDTPTSQTFTTGNLTLFKADGAVTYGDKTIYGCRVWNNETLQRDLVPCYRKSDNVKGMYDLVSNQFLTNVGTGSFTKGNDIQKLFVYDIIKI